MLLLFGFVLAVTQSIFLPLVSDGSSLESQTGSEQAPIVSDDGPSPRIEGILFDDSAVGTMTLTTSTYAVGFSKENGSIVFIEDMLTNELLSTGSNNGCLWGTHEPTFGKFIGGCSFSPSWGNLFTYTWSAENQTLQLSYIHDPTVDGVDAQVVVTPAADHFFDMQLTLANGWGHATEYVSFPTELKVTKSKIDRGILPFLPGVELNNGFFAEGRTFIHTYPAPYVADFIGVEVNGTLLSMFILGDEENIQPVDFGFQNKDGDTTLLYHTYFDVIGDGASWSSPTVRLQVGGTLWETIDVYRESGPIEAFDSVEAKIKHGDRYRQLSQSPLLKADFYGINVSYARYESDVFPRLPSPSIFHPVTYWDDIFDQDYPDFHNVNLAYGSEAEMASMFANAGRYGHFVMPYINPTWWDSDSDIMQSLLAAKTLEEIVVLDANGDPLFEFYGPNGGYVISPHVTAVQKSLDRLLTTMMKNHHVDFFFEDQIGARPTMLDFGNLAHGPTDYAEAWLAYTENHPSPILMTEGGYDRLAQTEAGFHGGVLLSERLFGVTDGWWGDANWQAIPFGPSLLRDKVFFYQHDLAPETMTAEFSTLNWNLSMGYMLSYDLHQTGDRGGLESPWLQMVGDVQKNLLSHYASERITGFVDITSQVKQTSFETVEVTVNHSLTATHPLDSHVLAPEGSLIKKYDGSLIGGYFTQFNGQPLINGSHFLIVQTYVDKIVVRQPMGDDTALLLDRHANWDPRDKVIVWGYDRDGNYLSRSLLQAENGTLRFDYQTEVNGHEVAFYVMTTELLQKLPDDIARDHLTTDLEEIS
ncbi:MAG: hypothetical protein AAF633_05115 [Chloroflexota bacterium]